LKRPKTQETHLAAAELDTGQVHPRTWSGRVGSQNFPSNMDQVGSGPVSKMSNKYAIYTQLDAGMWRYHANRMDARRSQFDLGRVVAYI